MWWLRSIWVLTWSTLASTFIIRGLACSKKATCGAVIPWHFKSHHPPQVMINSRLIQAFFLDMAEQKLLFNHLNNTNFQNCHYFTWLSSEDYRPQKKKLGETLLGRYLILLQEINLRLTFSFDSGVSLLKAGVWVCIINVRFGHFLPDSGSILLCDACCRSSLSFHRVF